MDTAITPGSVLFVIVAFVEGVRRIVFAQSLVARRRGRQRKAGRPVSSASATLTGITEILTTLARTRLESEPGAQMVFSNFGVGLLGYALSRQQSSYEAAIRAGILAPLDMDDTGIEMNDSQGPQMAQGYRGAVRLGPLVFAHRAATLRYRAEPLRGAGAIVSSARDGVELLQQMRRLSRGG